jgi:hypothetical protein
MNKHYNVGKNNGMYGIRGKRNPSYIDGRRCKKRYCIDCKKLGIKKLITGKLRCRFHSNRLNAQKQKQGKEHHWFGKKSPKHSKRMKKMWKDINYSYKQRRLMLKGLRLKPNKPETLLGNMLNVLFPKEYKLNVRGEVMILGGKIPDFVNVNGQKKVIEMFGDWFHSDKFVKKNGCKEDTEKGRIKYFKKLGYETLIVWEKELKDIPKLKQKLIRFHNIK